MPSEYVRPKPSQVPPLGEDAIAAYERMGWTVTPSGGIDAGVNEGPCSNCRSRTILYGPGGNPLCTACREALEEKRARLRREAADKRAAQR